MKINIDKKIVVIKLDIIVASLRDAQPFWDEFESNLIFERKKIIIDLSECNYVDSTFIGMIIKIFKKVNEKNGQLKLVFPQMESVVQFWAIGITKIMDCYSTLDEAIDSYRNQLPVRNINYDDKHSVIYTTFGG